MPEGTKQTAAGIHWLATLLTGREIALDVIQEATTLADDPNTVFSTWMHKWSRRLVIARALATVRQDLAASARRTELRRVDKAALPPRSWVLDQGTTRSDLERALLSIDVFPRAAFLLLAFEAVPLIDAATLLNAGTDLVRKAQAAGARDLTVNLARMQGWKPYATDSNKLAKEWDHA